MPSRKSSKNSHDQQRQAYANGGYNYGPPQYGSYNRYVPSSGYGSYNPYGTVGYAGSMDRRGGAGGMRDGLYPGTKFILWS